MLVRGVLINASHNICYAHDEKDIAHVITAWRQTLAVVADELNKGELERRLGCPAIEPVFVVRQV
jgi:hypothetical protein